MNPTSQRLARQHARLEDDTDPGTLALLSRRMEEIERRLGRLDLRLADAFAGARQNVRAELDQLRAELVKAGTPIQPPARRTPKRTATPSNNPRKSP